MESGVLPRDSIFSIGTMGAHYLMERRNAIARFEFSHIRTNILNDTGYVIPLVRSDLAPVGDFPVLRIGTTHDNLNKNLVCIRLWNGRVNNFNLWPLAMAMAMAILALTKNLTSIV